MPPLSASTGGLYEDVSDPSDWIDTPLSCLAPLENALRCLVCRDFFKIPMLTSCGHNFCSECIRRCLSTEGKCPACRTSEQENRLRSNWALEKVVEEFQSARPTTLACARKDSATNHSPSPKRKLNQMDNEQNSVPLGKRTRFSSRRVDKSPQPKTEMIEVDDEREGMHSVDDNLVACPACSLRVKLENINDHIDDCTNEDQSDILEVTSSISRKSSPNKLKFPGSTGRPNPLPKLNYSLLKEAALRKKLAELGISTAGNRQLLERRHTEWLVLWNANCDSAKPRKKQQLLQELEIWDRTQGARAPSAINVHNASDQIRNENFNRDGWSSKHGVSFQELIEQARRKVHQKPMMSDANKIADCGQKESRAKPKGPGDALATGLGSSIGEHGECVFGLDVSIPEDSGFGSSRGGAKILLDVSPVRGYSSRVKGEIVQAEAGTVTSRSGDVSTGA